MPSPLVKAHLPICSVKRAKELGFDLKEVATCARPDPQGGVRGCACYDSCRFDRPQYGGFKDDRPHIVGYFLRTIEGSAKRDFCACHTFVQTLQPRMDDGRAMRERGESKYETVRLIGQEGDPIKVRVTIPVVGKDGKTKWVNEVREVPIPEFADPTENDAFLEYEREIIAEDEEMTMGETSFSPTPAASLAEPVAKPRPGQTR